MSEPGDHLDVMVFSAFADLPGHREALIDLLHAHGLQAREMGDQADALDVALAAVRAAAAYICLIGHSDGQVPVSSIHKPDALSISELALDEAVRLRRPILLFLMVEDHPGRPEDLEMDRATRERAWQKYDALESGRICRTFSGLPDFRQKAGPAIAELRAFIDRQRGQAGRRDEGAAREPRYRWPAALDFGPTAETYALARTLVGVVCAAVDPLSTADLAQILGISAREVLELSERMADLLKRRVEGERSLLSVDHLSLEEWLTPGKEGRPGAGAFAVDLAEARVRLHAWARGRADAGEAHTSPYLLRHLAAHLRSDAERQAVYARLLLTCFEWSQAQLDLSGVRGLLADVQHLGRHPDAGWLRGLIRQAEAALRDSTAQWAAQVLGRLGTGGGNIGLESLARAAERWALARDRRCAVLLPLRRSLRWRARLQRQLAGSGPIVVLPDGRFAYARGAEICVCDPDCDDEPQVLEGHTDEVGVLAALPDGRLASASADCSVRVWSLTGSAPEVLEGHTCAFEALAVLPDGRLACAGEGSDGGTLRVWSLTGAAAPQVLELPGGLSALAVLPDGRVVTGDYDGRVRVWSLTGGAPQVLKGHHKCPVHSLAVLPDGRVVAGGEDNSVRVWP